MDSTAIDLLTELIQQQQQTNVILLFTIGTISAIGVCVLLYKVIKIFY